MVKHGILSTEIQIWVIEQQTDGNDAQLAVVFSLSQFCVQWVFHPLAFALHLGGDGEFIVFLGYAFAVFLNHFADGDAP